MHRIEMEFANRVITPSDINEHLLLLYSLALGCESVTEFGIRYGASTTALLAAMSMRKRMGLAASYLGYDVNPSFIEIAGDLFQMCPNDLSRTAVVGNSMTIRPVPPTCLLLIDSQHEGEVVYRELERHASFAKRYLVFHDTVTFGKRGELGGLGLLRGIEDYMKSPACAQDYPWSLKMDLQNNNGLTVYERIKQ